VAGRPESKIKIAFDLAILIVSWLPLSLLIYRVDHLAVYKLLSFLIEGDTLLSLMGIPVGISFMFFILVGGLSPESDDVRPSIFLLSFPSFCALYPLAVYAAAHPL
jgi:hypothetical protein